MDSKIKKELTEEMAKGFGFPNDSSMAEYLEANFGEAIDAYPSKCIYDVDKMIHLKDVLGFRISYELFSYIDDICFDRDIDIFELNEGSYDWLMEICKEYAHREAKFYEELKPLKERRDNNETEEG